MCSLGPGFRLVQQHRVEHRSTHTQTVRPRYRTLRVEQTRAVPVDRGHGFTLVESGKKYTNLWAQVVSGHQKDPGWEHPANSSNAQLCTLKGCTGIYLQDLFVNKLFSKTSRGFFPGEGGKKANKNLKRPSITHLQQDRFTTCFKTCGTGSLFWGVGSGCKVNSVQSFFGGKKTYISWMCKMKVKFDFTLVLLSYTPVSVPQSLIKPTNMNHHQWLY